jgi:hypothetical protein
MRKALIAAALLCIAQSAAAQVAPTIERGEVVYLHRPVALRVSSRALLAVDIDYGDLECDRTGSCLYLQDVCRPWIVVKDRPNETPPYILIFPAIAPDPHASNGLAARKAFELRLFNQYLGVMSPTRETCMIHSNEQPRHRWIEVRKSGFWSSWRGFEIRGINH